MAKLVALKFNDNYADEFDIEGIQIMERRKWEDYREKVRDLFDKLPREHGYYFGTNELLEWNSAEDYLSCITELDHLSQGEILVLKRAIGATFGIFPILEFNDD